ncbi:MAG: hypothetical protein ACTHLO_20910, partial [Pseudolabrys sp.]
LAGDRRRGCIMVLGLSLAAFTILHVLISLAAILAGAVVTAGMLRGARLGAWTAFFLALTLLTSLTGFLFPIKGFTPALGTGAVSVVILLLALWALYAGHLRGNWRRVYVVCAVAALYLNVLVLIVQGFLKVPPLHALAPTGSEPPFLVAQTLALIVFVVLGILALRRFDPPKISPAL